MQDGGIPFTGRLFKNNPYETRLEGPLEHSLREVRYNINRAARNKEWTSQVPFLWKALDALQTSEQTLCLLVFYKSPLWSQLPQEIMYMVREYVAAQNKKRYNTSAPKSQIVGEIMNAMQLQEQNFVHMGHFGAQWERADGAHFDDE